MDSKAGGNSIDLWSEIVDIEGNENEDQQKQPQFEEVYRRRRPPEKTHQDINLKQCSRGVAANRVNLAAADGKRISWNRSLSTRGRTSIAIGACLDYPLQQKQARRKGKHALPKGKFVKPPNFEKERAYFEEVDAFELLEESPSPKKNGTWAMGSQFEGVVMPNITSRLEKWLLAKKLNYSIAPSSTLSKILETPAMEDPTAGDNFDFSKQSAVEINPQLYSVQCRLGSAIVNENVLERITDLEKISTTSEDVDTKDCEDLEVAIKKLSLASKSSTSDHLEFDALLAVCGQSHPFTMKDVFSKYCDLETIVKVGEGTYGEAFKAGNTVCKIVPIDGDLRVNGEVQKRSEELLEEVILSRTLNCLRRNEGTAYNFCTTFIETIDLRVCQGPYDEALIRAWEHWDEKHGSENDHPKKFSDEQCYVIFVLQHGGKDLESFVLLNFDEARSLLVQVTAALAVAEAAYEFEHRDLHWGNILLSRHDSSTLQFIIEGKHIIIQTFGLLISIIDFTLSRINTGEDILFLDLSLDPDLFKGPKGDRQSETYRKMKDVTEDCWDGSFPRTNVLWLLYLVDILLLKKSFKRESKNERDLRSLKKRLDNYRSAKEAILDPFFSDLIANEVD